ncbi:MAG TPA: glutamate-5-semialdehyde dehydrogenase [Gammaproteobacteria bacterium]|nr:glutamate-5-semialdehyde dehydrogenase [Gammaproteobacteria bacterium]
MTENHDISQTILHLCQAAREAAYRVANASTEQKNQALYSMAAAIRQQQDLILAANAEDRHRAEQADISPAFLDRLLLNAERIEAMAASLEAIATLPDPVGTVLATIERPNGLHIRRVRVPIGVIGVIYESRPNVTADAAGLCLKSGNAVILRCGSESFHSATAILRALQQGLQAAQLPLSAVQMITTRDRAAVKALLSMDKYIDVIIPRGGPQLIASIMAETRIPLFKHLAGICHTYVHQEADLAMARKIVFNAKLRRTGICGATEVLLIDQAIVASHLSGILQDLFAAGCEIRGDQQVVEFDSRVKLAKANDYDTEFLAPILAVKIVKDLSQAIAHIAEHGTQHTDAIITANEQAAQQFLQKVDSAIVIHNASTQFADGGEFGMGAEIGIATGKLHARGPVGVEQLTTFKYQVQGSGQVR